MSDTNTDRFARVVAIRASIKTDADCAALAQQVNDEISALGMRLVVLHPEKREAIGRLLNDARIAVSETLRSAGIGDAKAASR